MLTFGLYIVDDVTGHAHVLRRYYLWQVVPINNYKKTDNEYLLPTSGGGLKGPVSTYGVVLTSVSDMR